MHGLGLLAVVADDDARAADDLPGVALAVDLAETDPLAELLGVLNLDQVDVVLSAESLDELGVVGFVARLGEDAEVGLLPVGGNPRLAKIQN